ncbi:MAG: DNA alkylation repair protein, partial [Actinomycetota bacterium]
MVDATPPDTLDLLAELEAALTPLADPESAVSMAAYMQDHFDFLGIRAGDRRQAQRPVLNELATLDGPGLLRFAKACWAAPFREYQYTACRSRVSG